MTKPMPIFFAIFMAMNGSFVGRNMPVNVSFYAYLSLFTVPGRYVPLG
jgi:hypothetical protein